MTPEQEARLREAAMFGLWSDVYDVPGLGLRIAGTKVGEDVRALLAEVDRLRESATIWMNALHTACVIVGADTCAGSPAECLEAIRTATSTEPKGESNA